uniref:Transport and Golgi organization protein 2 homolog n=1 Tax=Angiostrongylus cantonensis TaxID=6313 RepID=A0A0K0CW49_ANGCA
MCITFVFVSDDPCSKYKLIILNNRDENLDRPTLELDWRDGVLSGIDLQDAARGTWFGMNKSGRIGILLSITQSAEMRKKNCPSRGTVVPCDEFFNELAEKASEYNGFQFLVDVLLSHLQRFDLNGGTYVWSNSPPEKPFRKVTEGKKLFEKFVASLDDGLEVQEIIEKLLKIATDETKHCPDPQIEQQTGLPEEHYRNLCSIMVKFPPNVLRYGTRSHSILIVDHNDNATFYEKRITSMLQNNGEAEWVDKTVTLKLNPL